MKSLIVRRSFMIGPGRKTSATLEPAFWTGLQEIADKRHMSLSRLIRTVVAQGPHKNLSSALHQFVLEFYRSQVASTEITVPNPPRPPASP